MARRQSRAGGGGRRRGRSTSYIDLGERKLNTRQLGARGPSVSALGLGCMGMSGMYGPADRAESIATIHAALEAGIDSARHRRLLRHGPQRDADRRGAARARRRENYLLSVKFGALRDPVGGWVGYDARPAGRQEFRSPIRCKRLGMDYIDIYRPARLDPDVPDRGDDRRHRRPGQVGLHKTYRAFRDGRGRPSAARPPSIRSATCRSNIP